MRTFSQVLHDFMREVRRRSPRVDEGFSVFAPLLVPLESGLCGSSLGIEFVLNQDHGQFGALCLDERSNRIQNRAAVAALCDPPASTLPLCLLMDLEVLRPSSLFFIA